MSFDFQTLQTSVLVCVSVTSMLSLYSVIDKNFAFFSFVANNISKLVCLNSDSIPSLTDV